jgi:hypothetical protein
MAAYVGDPEKGECLPGHTIKTQFSSSPQFEGANFSQIASFAVAGDAKTVKGRWLLTSVWGGIRQNSNDGTASTGLLVAMSSSAASGGRGVIVLTMIRVND